jgi:hypothetical protein
MLHDSNRLEEEKIDTFFNDFFFFQLNSRLNEKNNNTHFQLLLFFPLFSKINQMQGHIADMQYLALLWLTI